MQYFKFNCWWNFSTSSNIILLISQIIGPSRSVSNPYSVCENGESGGFWHMKNFSGRFQDEKSVAKDNNIIDKLLSPTEGQFFIEVEDYKSVITYNRTKKLYIALLPYNIVVHPRRSHQSSATCSSFMQYHTD